MERLMFVQDFLKLVNYRVTEGQNFGWDCYGKYAYSFTSEISEGGHDIAISCIFDLTTSVVYEFEVYLSGEDERAYRWISESHIDAYHQEALKRGVSAEEAYEGMKFNNVDTSHEIYEIAETFCKGRIYEPNVEFTLNLPESMLDKLCELAWENSMTVDELIPSLVETYREHTKTQEFAA
jgi:hypothetical protein